MSTLGLFLVSYFAITGAVYRFSRNVLGMNIVIDATTTVTVLIIIYQQTHSIEVDKQNIGWLLQYHQGEFVQHGSVVFTFVMLVVSLGLLGSYTMSHFEKKLKRLIYCLLVVPKSEWIVAASESSFGIILVVIAITRHIDLCLDDSESRMRCGFIKARVLLLYFCILSLALCI